jgi:hypothetical protein
MATEESFKGKQWKVNVLYWESQSTIFRDFHVSKTAKNGRTAEAQWLSELQQHANQAKYHQKAELQATCL